MKLIPPGFRIRRSYSTSFSSTGDHLAVVGRDVTIWSVVGRKRQQTVSYVRNPSGAVFSPDESVVLIKDTAGSFMTCDSTTADAISAFRVAVRDEGSEPVFFDADTIIDASWSGEIRMRQLDDLSPTLLWRGSNMMVQGVLRSASNATWVFPVSLKHGHSDFERGGDFLLLSEDPLRGAFHTLNRSWQFLRACALSPAGDRVAVRHGAKQHAVDIVDIPTNNVVCTTSISQGGTGWNLSYAPDGAHLVLVEKGGFSVRRSHDLHEVGWWPTECPAHIEFSPGGHLTALADWKNGIVLSSSDFFGALQPRPASAQSGAA